MKVLDKDQYKIKLEEITRLAQAGDFEGAAQAVDEIDWRHVKSVRTLCMVAEIYEANKRYEDSERILKYAYRRSSVSKTVLYRLTEINIRMKDYEEAEKYLDEFTELSPRDTSRYVLQYKLLRRKGAPIDDQIAVLKEYKDREYTERWAYELARLYKQSGQKEKCIEECDDLILWFSEGKYVIKAMELKMTLTSLSEAQQQKYDTRYDILKKEEPKPVEVVPVPEVSEETAAAEAEFEEVPEAGPEPAEIRKEAAPEPAAPAAEAFRADAASLAPFRAEDVINKMDAAADANVTAAKSDDTPNVMPVARAAGEPAQASDLQDQLASSIRAVFAGMRPTSSDTFDPDATRDIPELPHGYADAAGSQTAMPEADAAAPYFEEEVGGGIDFRTGKPVEEKVQKTVDLNALFAETNLGFAKEIAEGGFTMVDEVTEETAEEPAAAETEMPEDDLAEEAEEAVEEAPAETEAAEEEAEEAEKAEEAAAETVEAEPAAAETAEEAEEETEAAEEMKDAAEETAESAEEAEGDASEKALEAAAAEEAAAEQARLDLYGKETDESLGLTREFNFREELRKAVEDGEADEDIAGEIFRQAEESSEPVSVRSDLPDPVVAAKEAVFGAAVAGTIAVGAAAAGTAAEAAGTAAGAVGSAAVETAAEAAGAAVGKTAEILTGAGEAAGEAAEAAAEAGEAVEEAAEEAGEVMTESGEAVEEAAEDAAGTAEEAVEEAAETVEEDAVTAGAAAEAYTEDAAETGEAVEEAAEEAMEAAAGEAAVTAAEEAEEAMDLSSEVVELPEELREELLMSTGEVPVPDSAEETAQAAYEGDLTFVRSDIDRPSGEMTAAIMEEPVLFERVEVVPRKLDETETRILSYFAKIPGIAEQLTMAVADIHNNAGDKTSLSGNVLVMGRQGTGKTRLVDCLILAACRDLGITCTKMARVIGRDLNKKEPAEVVRKLSGGFLLIEGAGELNEGTVEKLSQAMEFRTDDLIVILEDEKPDLQAMLAKNPVFAEKFTSTIVVPVFTNDELVTFARTYAREQGYKLDEMGTLALYTMIGENQTNDQPVTIGLVKEMMDKAIRRASSHKLGRRFSKNAKDANGRIYLRERDFNF